MAQQHLNYSFPNDGLGDALRNAMIKVESNTTELYGQKVDKVVGKGLSDTNFTQVEKDKLAALDPSYQASSDWNETNPLEPGYIDNKPTNTSAFTNDGADGSAPYIPDVVAAGTYARQAGVWVGLSEAFPNEPVDFLIDTTPGYPAGTQDFTLDAGKKAFMVLTNFGQIAKITPNNAFLAARWSQTGDIVTLTETTVTGDYIYILYQ